MHCLLRIVARSIIGAFVISFPSAAQNAPLTALRFGALVNPSGGATRDAVIVVQGDTILRVGTGAAAVPAGARVIDLRRYTAIPGMIDVHTHMTYWRDKANLTAVPTRSKDSVVMAAAENARKTLETGVTTVRDLGASNYADIAMRDSINKGAMIGPRMFVAGYGLSKVTTPPRAGAPPGAPRGRVQDTLEIKEAIKAQVDAGADWIKMYGSTGSFQNVTGQQTFTDTEMRVAAETAHRYGKPIAIHSYGDSGGRAAMRAGAESVEHPAGLDDATLAEFVKRGTYYVPTIDHNRFYAENAKLLGYTAEQVAALDSFRLFNLETARRAHKAGVTFAMGSDAVYWMFGENTRELAWFVAAGMTPAQSLATATTSAAELLRLTTKLGRIAPGYFADIVAVDGDPLRDINVVINNVKWVMKGGAVVVDRTTPSGGSRHAFVVVGVPTRTSHIARVFLPPGRLLAIAQAGVRSRHLPRDISGLIGAQLQCALVRPDRLAIAALAGEHHRIGHPVFRRGIVIDQHLLPQRRRTRPVARTLCVLGLAEDVRWRREARRFPSIQQTVYPRIHPSVQGRAQFQHDSLRKHSSRHVQAQ